MVPPAISFPDVKEALTRISKDERATTQTLCAAQLMQFWLWGCDANEVCDRVKCDFHLMHLTGIVCVRVFTEAYHHTDDSLSVIPLIIDCADIEMLVSKSGIFLPHFYKSQPPRNISETDEQTIPQIISIPSCISLQQLRDLVHAVQTQWPLLQRIIQLAPCPIQREMILQTVDRLITQLFIWFGAFLFSQNLSTWQADDNDFVGAVPPAQHLALTDMGIKFYLNIFFILFRLLFLQRHSVAVPVVLPPVPPQSENEPNVGDKLYPFEIETFHVEAGIDDFHTLGMYFDIPAGCLLEYKHSYSGYYNNVSQCVYRHFPSYKRRLPVSLAEILMKDAHDLSVLPALKQIYPEIEYAFEDHHFHREVGSVRKAVLMCTSSCKKAAKLTKSQTQVVSTTLKNNQKGRPLFTTSEKIVACLASCNGNTTDGGGDSGNNAGGEGSRSAKPADWLWFVIGSTIYLVDTRDGVMYNGSCRDLLTFYLSTH